MCRCRSTGSSCPPLRSSQRRHPSSSRDTPARPGFTAAAPSIIVARYAGPPVRTAVRRLFLLFLNITPGGVGTWRREFSTRETAAATWLFVFVLVLLVFVLVS